MDAPNNTCSKTIKENRKKPRQLHNREMSCKMLYNMPGIRIDPIYDKKTCKGSLPRNPKRGNISTKAKSIAKINEPSTNKLQSYLSEKKMEPKFAIGKFQRTKKQVYVDMIESGHFVKAKYGKTGCEKSNYKNAKSHQRHRSNLSLSKQIESKIDNTHKNSSLLASLLAKNIKVHMAKDKTDGNINDSKNMIAKNKKGLCGNFSKFKHKIKGKKIKESINEIEAPNHTPFYSNHDSPMQGSAKKISVDSKDLKSLKKYFFNIQAAKKPKIGNKTNSQIDDMKQPKKESLFANKKPNISTRRLAKIKQSFKNNITVHEENVLSYDSKKKANEQKETVAFDFAGVLKNIYKDKETKDVKNVRQILQDHIEKHNKVPETSLQFYQIIKLLGKGSFGKVYLGLQRLTNRLVAIKCLEKAHMKDDSVKRKILSEVKILKAVLGHPNIVKLLEVFENKKYVFFVTEYASNGDLLKLIKNTNKVPEHDAKYMFFQIAMGLRYIHQQGIIHRDIKPDNILIDESNRCKICDFGVSRHIDPKEKINEQCGTPAYLAPEIIKDEGYKGFGVDIWSLGVLLYCLLTGHMPFKASTIEELHNKILEGKVDFPENYKLSPGAVDLISKMLVLDPNERITIEGVVKHEWVKNIDFDKTTIVNIKEFEKCQNNYLVEYKYEINDFALNNVCELGFTRELVEESVIKKELNHASACYFNLEKDLV